MAPEASPVGWLQVPLGFHEDSKNPSGLAGDSQRIPWRLCAIPRDLMVVFLGFSSLVYGFDAES